MKCKGKPDNSRKIPCSITFSPQHFILYRGKYTVQKVQYRAKIFFKNFCCFVVLFILWNKCYSLDNRLLFTLLQVMQKIYLWILFFAPYFSICIKTLHFSMFQVRTVHWNYKYINILCCFLWIIGNIYFSSDSENTHLRCLPIFHPTWYKYSTCTISIRVSTHSWCAKGWVCR